MTEASAARGARELFGARFGEAADGVWLAPGRANLMGEHTDYNDGYVLPFALGQSVAVAAARRAGGRLVLCSRQQPDRVAEIDLGGLAPGQVAGWAAYPAGVAWALRSAGYQVPGAHIAVDSDLPAGAGLSSSAALECATALALTELAGLDVPRAELAGLACRAAVRAAVAGAYAERSWTGPRFLQAAPSAGARGLGLQLGLPPTEGGTGAGT